MSAQHEPPQSNPAIGFAHFEPKKGVPLAELWNIRATYVRLLVFLWCTKVSSSSEYLPVSVIPCTRVFALGLARRFCFVKRATVEVNHFFSYYYPSFS